MLVLAIDTSSAAITVALAAADGDVTTRRHLNARGHGELLAPTIADCLSARGVAAGQLRAIVAGVGPGPFTGLRVGLVTAAALGDALGIPTYGVCSLDAVAVSCDGPLLVAGDARRREVYWARYDDGVRHGEPAVDKPGDIALDGFAAMTGAGARLYADVLGRPLLDADYPDPVRMIELARERWAVGAPSEALVPLYLRRPDAVEPKIVQVGDAVTAPADGGGVASVVAMRPSHIDELMVYERAMFGPEAWSKSAYRAELADTRTRRYFAAERDGSLVGWAGVRVVGDEAEILTIGVVPSARRRGIARILLDELLAEARSRGARQVFLEVRMDNAAAQGLYVAAGFAALGVRPGYYDGGRIDALTMRKELADV